MLGKNKSNNYLKPALFVFFILFFVFLGFMVGLVYGDTVYDDNVCKEFNIAIPNTEFVCENPFVSEGFVYCDIDDIKLNLEVDD